ncbi:MAG: helix-turn-helix domain-containing protein [Puniceicoccaceae bacterium]
MSFFYRPYVSVAERRRKAHKEAAALKKKGTDIAPVSAATPRGKIAASFWGQAWCDHLESYSDFANRLPRGRTYLRNGSVLHLGIEPGAIRALVMGSELYEQRIRIEPLPKAKWKALKKRCQGRIGSLVELLQGRLSDEIMAIVTDRKDGLFPAPREIKLDCSCPDWAGLCKHLAAALYGVGARLDEAPELLFKLRGLDHHELIRADASALAGGPGSGRRRLAATTVSDVFGLEATAEDPPARTVRASKKAPPAAAKTTARKPPRPGKKAPPPAAAKTAARKPARPGKKAASRQPAKKASGKAPPKSTARRVPPFQPTGPAVRRLRETLGLNRSAFARELGVSGPTIANWESAKGAIRPHARGLAALRKLHKACHGP